MGKKFAVSVLLDLVDRLSGPIKRPTQQLEVLERQVKRTDTAMDRLATGGKLVAAGAALAAPLILAFNSASNLNEALNKNAVVFGQHSREVRRWGDNSSQALGLARVEALETVGTFGNLFTSMGINRGKAAGLSMDIVQLGSDLASFNNTRPTDALQALRSGLTGEIEPLRRYGINLTAAGIAQKAFAMGLTPKVMQGVDLDPSVKALAAYQIILDQSKNAQGDFARTADGSANALRSVRGSISDLAGTIGTQLDPVFRPLIVSFRNLLFTVNRFAEANPILARALALTTLGVAALLTVVGFGLITIASFTLAVGYARTGLARYAGVSVEAAAGQGLLNMALAGTRNRFIGATRAAWAFTASLLANPVFLLIAAITLLGGSFVYAWRKSDEFRANVMRGLAPITRAWAGLKDDVASLGRAFGPLGTIFRGVMQRMGIDLSLVQKPLDALAYGFGYFIGFVGTATAIVFGRMIATLTVGLGGVVQIVDGLVTAAHGLVTLDFAKMMEGLNKARGGLEQTMLSPLELAGIDSKQFRDDLNSAGGKARAWQRQVGTWLGQQVKTGALNPRNLLDGLNRASEATSSWGVKLHDWIGQSFQTGRIQAQNLTGSLRGAGERAKTWVIDLKGRIGEQIQAGALRPENLVESLQRAGVRVSGWRTRLQTQIGERFQAAGIDAATFTAALTAIRQRTAGWRGYIADLVGEQWQMQKADVAGFLGSLREARETGRAIWGRISGWIGRRFQAPTIRPGEFYSSLREGVEQGRDIWGRVPNWLGKRVAAGKARVGDFLGSLREGKDKGGGIWARAETLLSKKIRLPGVNASAIQTSLNTVLETITGFGPQMLTAGQDLIGNLISGVQEKLGELTGIFDNFKLPNLIPGVNRGETPTDRATATARAAAPPIANRPSTPDPLGSLVGKGVSPNITFTPEQLVKISGVNPGSEYGKLLVEGLAQKVMTERQVANYAVNRMAADVEATFRKRLGIQSPSRVFMGLGSMVTQGLGQGIVGQKGLVTGAMRTLAAAALAVPVTAQLGVPALGDELTIPPPPAIGRAASEPSRGERARAEARAASEGRAQTKTITFPNATFNLDMAGMENGMDFLKSLKGLLDSIGDDE